MSIGDFYPEAREELAVPMLSSGTFWILWVLETTREGSMPVCLAVFMQLMCSEDKSQTKPTCALKHVKHLTSSSAAAVSLEVTLFLCWSLPSSPCVNSFFRP